MSEILNRIENAQVKTKADMIQLMKDASFAISQEAGVNHQPEGFAYKAGLFTATQLLPQAEYAQAPEPHAKIYPVWFKLMREEAQKNGATKTDKALLKSASWYYYNVENKGALTSSGNPEEYGIKPEEAKQAEKIAKRAKYIQWGMIGGSLIVGGTLLYFAFFHKPKDKKKSNPRKVKARSKSITRGKVRSRRRNKSASTIQKRNKPAISSSSSLANYRKRFEAEKKSKARKSTITRKNTKSKLKLKR